MDAVTKQFLANAINNLCETPGRYFNTADAKCYNCTNQDPNASSCTYGSSGNGSNNCGYASCSCKVDYQFSASKTCTKCPNGTYSTASSNTCTNCTNKDPNAASCTYSSSSGGSSNCGYASCSCKVDYQFSASNTCTKCPNGQYSPASSNTCTSCTNKPADAASCSYTSSGNGNNSCSYSSCSCNSNYVWTGSQCKTWGCSSSNSSAPSSPHASGTYCWCLSGGVWSFSRSYGSIYCTVGCPSDCRI
jgi:hypothetical protein